MIQCQQTFQFEVIDLLIQNLITPFLSYRELLVWLIRPRIQNDQHTFQFEVRDLGQEVSSSKII